MNNGLFYFVVALSSFILVEVIRHYSLKKNFLDTPNSRSSHSIPTPHGGGLAIVLSFLLVVGFSSLLPNALVNALLGSGILVAAIGFWDDQSHIAANWRLLTHFIAAIWVLYWLGGVDESQLFSLLINLSWFSYIFAAFALVWLLNLFNFMDGIDGIAASEAIFVACAGAYFSWLSGIEHLSYVSILLASSTLGFLILNWSPAKIFMGDVGSGFLGLILGVIAYANIVEGGSVWIWMILLAIFIVDSGMTLLRRIINKDKWYEAHCNHAYQHAARKWGHKKVTISTVLINLFWVFPLALLSYKYPSFGFMLTLFTFIPLIIIALKFKAGITSS